MINACCASTRRTVFLGSFLLLVVGLWLPACQRDPGRTAQPVSEAEDHKAAQAPIPATDWIEPVSETLGRPTHTFIDRAPGTDLRLVSYNVLWNNIFHEVSPDNALKFVRVMRALNPDIVCLQEIEWRDFLEKQGQPKIAWKAEHVATLMNAILPRVAGETWHAHQGYDNVILSKWPLEMTATDTNPSGDRAQAMALVDLPDDTFPFDFYVMNNHYKCCDAEKNDPRRQKQSDAITAWIRDVRTPGDHIDLPAGTAIAVVGDLNIVGSFQPVQTLIDGDIIDEAAYGADFAPDWDDSPLADAHPRHNAIGPDDYTWRDDTSPYDPGRLDYIIYSDSVLEAVHAFILNTTTMSAEERATTGLEKLDVTVDAAGAQFDHLPLVVDFTAVP